MRRKKAAAWATVSGWNNIGIEGSENRQAAVSLFGDLAYDGTLNIGRFGTLDFAQNNLKLSGDVENEGVLSLTNGKESGRPGNRCRRLYGKKRCASPCQRRF